jgi:hypothetical protein
MQTAIERHAPDTVYVVFPLVLAILAVVIDFLGEPGSAVGVALLAYATSALGPLLKM